MEPLVKRKLRRKIRSHFRKALRLCDQALDEGRTKKVSAMREGMEIADVKFYAASRQFAATALAQLGEFERRAS